MRSRASSFAHSSSMTAEGPAQRLEAAQSFDRPRLAQSANEFLQQLLGERTTGAGVLEDGGQGGELRLSR